MGLKEQKIIQFLLKTDFFVCLYFKLFMQTLPIN